VVLERGPFSLVSTIEELLERKKTGITAVGDPPRWLHNIPLSTEIGINFAGKRRSLSRYSSLAY
jgi:hypothetical protein